MGKYEGVKNKQGTALSSRQRLQRVVDPLRAEEAR